ncbi:sodium:alanine symporter family protein [Oscillibacter sp.]|uniref:alanine/glycine:cation symporter family protein n=1 Tax=Oscillibacter sp. TaxID=1945593 RepID=UPI002639E01C|nr:alanine/glycine:cation symporter family protein [Oscillibacter sp.]MDD3347480.1 alanine/glycine:cation symporter family protein [Oscillibacter sp.]
MVAELISTLSNWLYTYILVILLLAAGLYFTLRTRFVQIRLFGEAFRVLREKTHGDGVSSFQALMISTASRVGTGNIAGVSIAICMGGVGAVFWMWVVALLGGASAFIESTLAQIYKVRDGHGGSRGGPAYYIERALGSRTLAAVFSVCLLVTYLVGFNMVASFNLVDAFSRYEWFSLRTPFVVGGILAVVTAVCIFGGGERLSKVTSILVPLMGGAYVLVALIMIAMHIRLLPSVIAAIFQNAFDFQAIFGGFTGSAMMHGIKRGLFSNEAGVGSAPNAAAAASVSHPVKQGLAQMLSVFLDTLVICTATAFLCLCSGVAPTPALKGVPYVQTALASTFGTAGHWFITGATLLFAFTTILGNYYYCESNLQYLLRRDARRWEMTLFRLVAVLIVFQGAQLDFSLVWDTADVTMGAMTLINLPAILLLSKPALLALRDYVSQKRQGKDPVFQAADIGLRDQTEFWN